MKSLGLDVSATSTGMVLLAAALNGGPPQVLLEETICPKTRGMERCSEIAAHVLAVLDEHHPERVVIEGYGGAFKSSLIPLVEVGTVVRYFLRQCGYRWLEPAPTQVKKFVLGKQGEKSQMLLHVFKRWGFEPANDDTADGFGLAAIGLAHAGQLKGMTQPMREVVGILKLM